MSLEKDITEIKKVAESDIFKPATKEEVHARAVYYNKKRSEQFQPGTRVRRPSSLGSLMDDATGVILHNHLDIGRLCIRRDDGDRGTSHLTCPVSGKREWISCYDAWEPIPNETKLVTEDIFKPATPEELQQREKDWSAIKRKELYDNAERCFPGCVETLRQKLHKEELVQTAIAYADSESVTRLLPGNEGEQHAIRNLDWPGVWTDSRTFIKQCEIVEEYNRFNLDVAKMLLPYFRGRQFRLARESSVAVYIRPILVDQDGDFFDFNQSETSIDGTTLRLWWD